MVATTPVLWDETLVRETAEELKTLDGPLIPILHALTERMGYVDERAVPVVADVLNLSRAEVHGVVTFYHDFRHEPARAHIVKMCRAEACQSMGGERVYAELRAACAADAAVTVEPVYCLGNCALSPAALVDGELHGRVDTARVLRLVRG